MINILKIVNMFTVGLDPEFILTDQNKLVSAIGILPSKKNAHSFNGHRFYYDNVLAECAIKPAENKEQLILNIQDALNILNRIIYPAEITFQSAANYPEMELYHKHARKAGCLQEWCAYTRKAIKPPEMLNTFRSAGGHIHLGDKFLENPHNRISVVRMLDLFLALPSIKIDKDETAKKRRKIYGQAGTHRNPTYGLEYRTLSNFWLKNQKYISFIYDVCEFVINFVKEEKHLKFWEKNECHGYNAQELRNIINNCDELKAKKFLVFVLNYFPEKLANEVIQLTGENQ